MNQQDLMATPVSHLSTRSKAFSKGDSVSEAIGFMKETGSHEAFIEDDGSVSMVTMRDILGIASLETKLSALMRRVQVLNQNNTVADAAAQMFGQRSRSVPVRISGKLATVSSSSLVSRMIESVPRARLSDVMTSKLITVEPTSLASKVRSLMVENSIDQVPVVEGNSLKGIVTSEQIVFNLMPGADQGSRRPSFPRLDGPVGRFPIDDVVTSDARAPLKQVIQSILSRRASYSLIMDGGKPVGIVTFRDFMKLLLRSDVQELPMYVVGMPDDDDAGSAREKFALAVSFLKEAFPDITEARALVKTSKSGVEVKVLVLSPTRRYSYDASSHSLIDAFEQVHAWAKKAVSEYKPNRRRKVERPEFPE